MKPTDEALAAAAQAGGQRAEEDLISRYKSQVRLRAKAYYILGADREDVVQEGMIGLFKAVRSYDPAGGASFATYASVCIDRQIQDAIKAAARKKHEPLNMSLSLDEEGPARIAESQIVTASISLFTENARLSAVRPSICEDQCTL